MLGCEALEERVHVAGNAVEGIAGFGADDRLQEGRAAPLDNPLVYTERNPEGGVPWKLDARSHDAHHSMALAVQTHGLADNPGIGSKVSPPRSIRQNDDRRCAGSLVRAGEIPSQARSDAENAEEVVRNGGCLQLHGIRRSGLKHSGMAAKRGREYGSVFDSRQAITEIDQFRVGEFLDVRPRKRIRFPDQVDRLLAGKGQWAQQD